MINLCARLRRFAEGALRPTTHSTTIATWPNSHCTQLCNYLDFLEEGSSRPARRASSTLEKIAIQYRYFAVAQRNRFSLLELS